MSNVQSAKTARVDLLDDKKSIILTIGAADKTVTKFELTNDAASQLVSMIVMVAVMRPDFPDNQSRSRNQFRRAI